MKMASRLLAVLLLALTSSATGQETSPPLPPPIESHSGDAYYAEWNSRLAAELVKQLAAADFAERDAAHRELVELGLWAEDQLRAGLDSPDAEVSRRCRLILSDCLEADYRSRLAQFQAAVEREEWDKLSESNLPVWDRYQAIFGISSESTKLFLGMHQNEPGLFATAEADGAALGDAIRMRFQQAYQPYYWPGMSRRTAVPFETIAAILFLSSDPESDLPPSVVANPYWSSVVGQSSFRNELQKGEKKKLAMKLLGLWIVGPTSVNTLHQKLQMAIQYKVPAGLDLAVAALESDKTATAYRGYAAMAFGSIGGKEYSRRMEEMLSDDTECSRRIRAVNGKRFTDVIQVRDIALAWLIYHTGQKHKDYEWETPVSTFEQIKKGSTSTSLSFYNFGFSSDEQREKAHDKWKAWRKDNELPPLPEREFAKIEIMNAVNAFNFVANNNNNNVELARLPGLDSADRLYLQALDRAEDAIARGESVDASAALGEILADPVDYAFQPQRGTPLFRRLKPEAERLLSTLNDEGRAAYRLQFAARARRELAEALERGSIDDLRAIGRRYFHTEAGADATYIAAVRLRVSGQPLIAALLFSRLKAIGWDADRFEPALSLQLATCFRAAGFSEEAERIAEDIRSRWGDPDKWQTENAVVTAAGLSPEAIEYLKARVLEPAALHDESVWTMFRGNVRRNAKGSAGGAYLVGKAWQAGISDEFAAADKINKMIRDLDEAYREQRQTAIPTMQPLVVEGLLIVRTAMAMDAYEIATGELRWTAPMDDVLRDLARNPSSKLLSDNEDDREYLARGLRRRHWDDQAFGRLSSDGNRVFSIESHTLGVEGEIQRLLVRADGQRQLDSGALRGHNMLAAHDIASGKLLWSIGNSPNLDTEEDQQDDPYHGIYFLGAPLPLAGELQTIAMRGQDTLLLTIDPENGSLIHELKLDSQPFFNNQYSQLYSPLWMLDRPDHRCGASPSVAEGIMICRLSLNRYAAVDLVNRSVLWRFDPEVDLDNSAGNAWNNWQKQMLQRANRNPADHWADATPLIADGKVIITPSELDEMLCLGLRDGQLLWRAAREDGIYLAGIQDEHVVVVGRGSVRALDVANGKAKFDGKSIDLPPGATPSGIGYFHDGDYFVPLSTAEIARVDLQAGEVTARSLADDVYPGNLIAVKDRIISQSPRGVWVFDTLADRQEALAEKLANDNDPKTRMQLGETLLYQGKLREALAELREALKEDPDNQRIADLLATASLEGLRTDYEAYRNEVQEVLGESANPERRFRFLQEQAQARRSAGQLVEAFQTWIAAVELGHDPQRMNYAAAARAVRRDRFLSARLDELYQAASVDERKKMDDILAKAVDKMPLAKRIRYFGWHALADRYRLDRSEELLVEKKETWLEAEFLLRRVIGNDMAAGEAVTARQAEAIARLGLLLLRTKRYDEAALCFNYLVAELPETVCLEGKTGRELFTDFAVGTPAEDVRTSAAYWPVKEPFKETSNTSSGYRYQYLVPMDFTADPFAAKTFVEIDTGGTKLTGLDRFGANEWSVDVPRPDNNGWSYSNSVYSHSTGTQVGHLVLAWIGNRVTAINLLTGPKAVWTKNTHADKPPAPGMRRFMPMRLQQQRNFAPGFASHHAPLALLDDCVCFQQERKLLAVDPLTGEVLWRIDDIAEYSNLYSLGEALLVVSSDREQAMILSGSDGRVLTHRTLPSTINHIGWTEGRLIHWRNSELGREIVAYDPLADVDTFSQVYGENAEAVLVDGGQVAVLDETKGLEIWQLPSGHRVMSGKCDMPADLQHISVVARDDSYTLLTSVSGFENSPFASSQAMYGFIEVHGPAYGFDRKTGKQLWKTEIDNQRMRLHQPSDLPVLIFRNQRYKREGNRSRTSHAQLILDQRNGEKLHDEDNSRTSHFLYQTKVDLEKGTIEVLSSREQVKLYFGEERPKPKKDDGKPVVP